jgi:hypothetical protein
MNDLLCARCLVELAPGCGDFFRITIEAVADPTPPAGEEDIPPEKLRRRIEDVLMELQRVSEREAMDQVYRRLTLHLCGPCYRRWIEDPVAASDA